MANLTVAASEAAVNKLFKSVRDNLPLEYREFSKSGSWGPFQAGIDVLYHLEGGNIDLQSDGTVKLSELDVKWDTLRLNLGLDIPEFCIGGKCIIKVSGKCILRLPRICFFGASPDVSIPINLSGLITAEISGALRIIPKYFLNPEKGPLSDHQAHDQDKANQWQIFLKPDWLDLDIIDVADTVGDLVENIFDAIIDSLFGWAPVWAQDIIRTVFSWLVDGIRAILDIGDDIQEWISNLLGVSFDILDFIAQLIADYMAKKKPIFHLEDPYPILASDTVDGITRIPVLAPVANLGVTVNDKEMILEATF